MERITRIIGPGPIVSVRGAMRTAAWPASALIVLSHVGYGDPGYPTLALVCGGLLGAFALVGWAYAEVGKLPVIPIQLLRFYFAMAFPMFSPPRLPGEFGMIRLSSDAMVNASLGALLFCVCLIVFGVVGILIGRPTGRRLAPILDRKSDYSGRDTIAIRILAFGSIGLNLLCNRFSPTTLFGPFAYIATVLGDPGMSLGLLLWDAHQTDSSSSRILSWFGVGVLALGGFVSGFLGASAAPFAVVVLFVWTVQCRVPTALLVGCVSAILIINPAKSVYRELSWGQSAEVTLTQRAENWAAAFAKTYSDDGWYSYGDAATGVASRLSTLTQVIQMLDWVPTRVPRAGAQAWFDLPLSLVPRFLWPEKPSPTAEYSRRYATVFRLHSERTTRDVTITLPSVGDGYWRLGWFGVALEGAVMGLLYGLLQGCARRSSRGLMIVAIGSTLALGPEAYVLGSLLILPRMLLIMVSLLLLADWLPVIFAGTRATAGHGAQRTEVSGDAR